MGTQNVAPEDVAAALEEDDTLRRRVAAQIAASIGDADPPDARRRDLLKTLGLGGLLGAGGGSAAVLGSRPARAADSASNKVGETGTEVDVYLDELKDPGGDQVLDVDDTGKVAWNRGQTTPSIETDVVSLGDDDKAVLGANDDYAIIYDSTEDRLEFRDQTNGTTAYMPRSGSGNITDRSNVVVNVEMTTDQSISANTWTTVDYDNEVTDVNSTYDLANDQWSPANDGDYLPIAGVSFNVGADGDRIAVRIRNVTDGATVTQTDFNTGGADPANVKTMRAQKFLSSKTYEVQANNLSSSDTLIGTASLTNLTVVSI